MEKLESAMGIVEAENNKLNSQLQSRNMKIKQLQGTVIQNNKEYERRKQCFNNLSGEHKKAEENFKAIENLLKQKVEKQKKSVKEMKETQLKQDTHFRAD